ncbi:MAG: tripartite tricarboxylate transporter permease, partial [Alphaproteobacteria bacterium]
LSAVQQAFALLTHSWQPWLVVFPGILIGLVAGAIPGIQVSMAMAIVLPATFLMDFLSAMLFLTAIFTGGSFGAGVPAILMNIPGASNAVATAFDGYPMAQRGEHNRALGLALGASTIGTFFGYIILFVLIEPISGAVLRLGPSEFFVVILWGITLIAVLKGSSFARGLLGGALGLLVGTVGMSDLGVIRGTLGIPYLLDGVAVVPAMIGLFAASALFGLIGREYLVDSAAARALSFRSIFEGFCDAFRYPKVLLRGGLIGAFIGAIPGVGGSISNLVSYAETKRSEPDGDTFGTGNPKGVVAAESANSSGEGGSLITLLALGIPGGGGTAIMLAAFSMHNITGGPRFIREQTDIVYAIVLSNFAQAILLVIMGLIFIHFLAAVVKVPLRILVPSVLVLASYGSYGFTGSMDGPVTVLIAGCVGWLLNRYDYSIPAVVIGLLLGRMAEGELVRTFQISVGDPAYFLQRPVTIVLVVLLAASVFLPPLMRRMRRRTSALAFED